jgi:hypothetical protein
MTFTILPKLSAMMEIFELKLKKPFELTTQAEFEALVSAMVLKTIMMIPEEVCFFAPLETISKIEEVEAALEAHQIPQHTTLTEIFLEMPPIFESFMTPTTEMVQAFLGVIEKEA